MGQNKQNASMAIARVPGMNNLRAHFFFQCQICFLDVFQTLQI